MKLYWRPGRISNASLTVLAILALLCIVVIETNPTTKKQRWYEHKMRAVKLQAKGMEAIKRETLKLRKALDTHTDPAQTGMIGLSLSPITSVVGHLEAKQTSVNPNFAAVVVHLMRRLKLEPGDLVAVGASGSFPSLNLATLVGCKTLRLNCVMISSIAASMYGANDPRMTWLDMEQIAYREGVIDQRSLAASVGGLKDDGAQLSEAGVGKILRVVEKHKLPLIRTRDLGENIAERLATYREAAQGEPYKAYVNIGGNSASLGSHFTKVLFRSGINRHLPRKPIKDEGVMTLMMREYGLPVIHLSGVSKIAERYGLELAPQTMPTLGEGKLFYNLEYNLTLVWILFLFLVGATFVVVHFDAGKLFSGIPTRPDSRRDSPMAGPDAGDAL